MRKSDITESKKVSASKHNNRCANRAAAFLPFAAADLLAQQNRGAHGKAADQVCQRHHDLRAGSCPTKMAG